ncbi:TonB-dependent receptor plug domain-containing protein [Roseateles microcysteis]|uniref:TonB-dependent receptor plug domain-containing protein n=1 Tax=Roseateles microcysteis TaxID=3119057 RepID=UPI002FE69EB1
MRRTQRPVLGANGLGTSTSSKTSDYQRRTFRYFTNYDTALGSAITGRFTLGTDVVLYDSYELEGHSHDDGTEDAHVTAASWRNFGYYGVAEFGYQDRLYLTLAGRVDQKLRNVSAEHARAFQPRAGLSYVFGDRPTTVKLRTQWGTSARVPNGDLFVDRPTGNTQWRAATNLQPEQKVGWDAGVDVVWESYGSLSITRFDEEGRDLVMPVIVQTGRPEIRQYQNIGRVGNKGWEVEARFVLGPVGLRVNATTADNRILAISNAYRPGPMQVNQVGARRADVPRHAGGISATVNAWRGTVSVVGTWIGPRNPSISTQVLPTMWRLNLRAEQAFNEQFTLFGRIDNVLNDQGSERYSFAIMRGRSMVIGVRATF